MVQEKDAEVCDEDFGAEIGKNGLEGVKIKFEAKVKKKKFSPKQK